MLLTDEKPSLWNHKTAFYKASCDIIMRPGSHSAEEQEREAFPVNGEESQVCSALPQLTAIHFKEVEWHMVFILYFALS